jgi:hypothetical protein
MTDWLGLINLSRGASYVISFLISIQIPFPISHETFDVTLQNFSVQELNTAKVKSKSKFMHHERGETKT